MLQPALMRPGGLADVEASPTYGDLFRATREAADQGMLLTSTKGLEAEVIHREMLGYERFLITTAKHVQMLLTLADAHPDTHWRLAARLDNLVRPLSSSGNWNRAANTLGAAHDLLTTHTTGVLVPRTPEGHEMILGPASASACAEVTGLLLEAIESSRTLMHRGMLAQKHRPDHPIPRRTFRRIRDANQAASLYARSTMWDLRDAARSGASLAELRPAIVSAPALDVAFESSLGALRVLRQLAYSQSRSGLPASAASLRDLAELGSRFTDASSIKLPEPSNALDAVRHAHVLDQLEVAHDAWRQARSGLAEAVQGTTRAPAVYSRAVRTLLSGDVPHRLQVAVLTALPRLGIEASQISRRLGDEGALVTRQQIPGELRSMWLPINYQHQAEITDRFERAAAVSATAAAAAQEVGRSVATTLVTQPPSACDPHRDRSRGMGVQ